MIRQILVIIFSSCFTIFTFLVYFFYKRKCEKGINKKITFWNDESYEDKKERVLIAAIISLCLTIGLILQALGILHMDGK